MMKKNSGIFKGYIDENRDKCVEFSDQPLDPRLDLFSHSRVGMDWGYTGSGPLQLSFAMLVRVVGEEEAKKLRTLFSKEVVSKFPDSWEYSSKQLKKWVQSVQDDVEHIEYDLYTSHTPANLPSNVVKRVCQELNITQKRLAEILEVPEGTVSSWAVRDELPRLAKKAIEFYIAKQRNDQIVKQFKDLIALVS